MRNINVRVYAEKEKLAKEDQLSYKIAEVAAKTKDLDKESVEMVGNRIIDNASVAIAAINRQPVKVARLQALAHNRSKGARLYGLPADSTVHAEWAAWANNAAVRELDFHDTYLAADYSHPGDNIPALQAVAEQLGKNGADFVRGILMSYEVQVNLVKAICLHEHKIDHIAHLGPAVAAGLGSMLNLPEDITYQAINQALHTTISTRQSRKGLISSWKAYAPGHAGKLGVEAVDRAMRGEGAPAPIWEGEDSVIAWILNGRTARDQGKSPSEPSYSIPFPEPGEACKAIMETYTKEHSAEYQAQALIDLAFDLREKVSDLSEVKEIILHTSHHTHYVIGTGSGDPQKFDPDASRETLDHSIMYIFAVAMEDGNWHHVHSYTPERAHRESTVALWNKISTKEDPEWTKRYHDPDPNKKAFGARVEVVMNDGSKVEAERGVANAHPAGPKPFGREQYMKKFVTLTEDMVSEKERDRFFGLVENLTELSAQQVAELMPVVDIGSVDGTEPAPGGIFS